MLHAYETWIDEENLIPVLTAVGWACDYQLSPDDRSAVLAGIQNVSEEANRWFTYEIQGRCRVSIHVTQMSGSSNYTLRVQADDDLVRELNMITWLAQSYRLQAF